MSKEAQLLDRKCTIVTTVAATLALAAPALAAKGHGPASPDSHPSKGKAVGQLKNAVLTGTISALNGDGTVVLHVVKASHWGRPFKGADVTVDLSHAKLRVADTDGDGTPNQAGDVKQGDAVQVQARVARHPDTTATLSARKLIDRTNPPVDTTPEQPEQG